MHGYEPQWLSDYWKNAPAGELAKRRSPSVGSRCVAASNKSDWFLDRALCNRNVGSDRFAANALHGFSKTGVSGASRSADGLLAYVLHFFGEHTAMVWKPCEDGVR